ncbi:AcrR family transcriptional regulator [Paenibacillus phyllosphaerae]|uniref:AcrR family transcriptional regulator n=1 Tax=Paenibacillus phyllosphaerae TaxID=274593 RepID=A0A7W5FL30_9BACL|nr:TetR family transcriptional regulator [Paenibacillus phyllosphaerae]MBB3108643.1 AcrR family transcriptional regulator [Paenibacillus phyllosphaerae]
MSATTVNDKYNAILQAAIEIISEKGLYSTSISDIVKKAGVAQGTFYLYFRSKNALIPAIAQNLISITMEKIKEKTKDHADFMEFLRTFIEEIYNITDEYKDVIVLVYSGLAIDHSMEIWETIYKPYYQWFEDEMQRAIANNEIIGQLNVKWTSKMIVNVVENAAERFFIGRDQDITREESQREVFHFLQRSMVAAK